MRTLLRALFLSLFYFVCPAQIFAQAPSITYPANQTYAVNSAISTVSPTNSGGAVPATLYGQVSVFAGSGSAGSVNGTGTAASFNIPYGLATDASGNVYVAETSANLIRKITSAGVVTTLAGSGSIGFVNGTGTAASFASPNGVAADVSGNVYVADMGYHDIRKITSGGVVSAFAGTGNGGFADGTGTAAVFRSPSGVAVDALGNVYVADTYNHRIRKITSAGVVTTLAGSGSTALVNGNGTAASFNYPSGVALDAAGNVYVADEQNRVIRKITPSGDVTTFAGGGTGFTTDGTGTAASFKNPYGIATDAVGNVYVADRSAGMIRKISPAGVVSTLASTTFNQPFGVASDASGNIYVADSYNNQIRKVINTGYSISPALPAGLNFDATTGAIRGTPTATSTNTAYTITAYNTAGSSSATFNIAVVVLPPIITSFTPANGTVGTTVTISGSGFNATAASNIVFFGATKATVSAATATSLTVTVPTGATYQPITVLNGITALQVSSAKPFITTFTPNKGVITTQDISAKVDFAAGTNAYGVAVGDLDGDGKPDIAVANYTSNTVSIYRNISTSGSITSTSFAAKVDLAAGSNPYTIIIGDVDGDGKPDLVVGNDNGNNISVFRNVAVSGSLTTSSFATKVDFATGSFPESIAIGDLDGDGKPEIVVGNVVDNTISILRNISVSGGLTSTSFATKVDLAVGAYPENVAISDLDGDGKPDITVVNSGANSVSILRNIWVSGSITTSSFAPKVDFTTGTNPQSVAVADFDGDGKPDLAVANNGSNTISVLRNTATSGSITIASFAAKADLITGTRPQSIAAGDIDGDGKLDLVVANSTASTLSIFRNTAVSGTITAGSFATKVDAVTGAIPYSIVVADFDGDGKPDIATANVNGNSLSVLRNNPTAVFFSKATGDLSSLSTYGLAADGTGAAPTDFNGSGIAAFYQLANRTTYTLTSNLTIGSSLSIPAASTLDLGGQTLSLNAPLLGTGTLSGSNSSSLVANGTISGLTFATGKELLAKLTLSSNANLTLTSLLGIASTGSVALTASSTLNSGGFLTLKSDASGTAQIPALPAGATITGNVVVERYIADKRAWRLITSPVNSTQSINAAWQEGAGGTAANPKPGYGTFIIGSSTANGFDIVSSSGSLMLYNGSIFNYATSTNTTLLSSNPGYFLFSIGSRSINPTTGAHSSTTLRSTGALRTGIQNTPINAAGFTLLGNPYAAPVDFGQVTRSSSVPNQFYAWDINLGSNGAYVLVTNSGGSYTSIPLSPSGLNNVIPSGAAIFIQSDGTNAGSITFNESSKATAAGSGSFSNFATSVAANSHNLRVNLTDAGANLLDGVMASFATGYSNKVDAQDALKLTNFYENISLSRLGKQLTMERRSDLVAKDTIFIQLSGIKSSTYRLQVDPADFNMPGMITYLQDAYLNTRTKLDVSQLSYVSFTTTTDSTSYKNRFQITFAPETKKVDDIAKISHIGAVVVAYPNPATQKQVNLSFEGMPAGTYNITVMNTFGQIMQKNSMNYTGATGSKLLNTDYSSGVYTVNIQSAGYNQSIKVIIP